MPSDRARIEALEYSLHMAFTKLFEHEDKLKELPEERSKNAMNTLLLSTRVNAITNVLSREIPTFEDALAKETAKLMQEVSEKLGITD